MDDTILLKIMFLCMGGIFIGYSFITGLYYLVRKKKEKRCTCKTYGKIINNIRRTEHIGSRSNGNYRRYIRWYSLCEYTVEETKCIRETNIGTLEPRKVGQIVTVYYNPNNCHEAYIEGDNNSGIKAIVCFALGSILTIFIYFAVKFIS